MNPLLLEPEVQHFLSERAGHDPVDIALRGSPFPGINGNELAAQVEGKNRCKRKLPTWFEMDNIYYPGRLAIEQSSSEVTASYKSLLIPAGCRLLDMTGGMGVDSYYFAKRARKVNYCELDPSLGAITTHNLSVLGASNITCKYGNPDGDGVEHLRSSRADDYDLVYLDPARRAGSRKVFMLADCQPDVRGLQSMLLEKSTNVLIKLSPMLDIRAALRELDHISEIHVVSVDGECKELLFLLNAGVPRHPESDAIKITAVLLKSPGVAVDRVQNFTFTLTDEIHSEMSHGDVSTFLYDPDAAVLKAGAFKSVATRFGLTKLHQHTHLYTSVELVADFPGRIMRVRDLTRYAEFKKYRDLPAGNVVTRNFPLKVEVLRQKHGIAEAADRYYYFCTNARGERIVIETVRVNPPAR